MLEAIVPILDFSKGVTITDHESEDTYTEFKKRMQESSYVAPLPPT